MNPKILLLFQSTIKNQLRLVVHWKFCKCFRNHKDNNKVMLVSFSQCIFWKMLTLSFLQESSAQNCLQQPELATSHRLLHNCWKNLLNVNYLFWKQGWCWWRAFCKEPFSFFRRFLLCPWILSDKLMTAFGNTDEFLIWSRLVL